MALVFPVVFDPSSPEVIPDHVYAWGANGSGQLGLGDNTERLTPTRITSQTDTISATAGSGNTLLINRDQELYATGAGENGKLGLGNTTYFNSLQRVGSASDWDQVSSSWTHSLGIRNGDLYAWGSNGNGQLGDGTTTQRTSPVRIGSNSDWEFVCTGVLRSFGIRSGELYSWGWNTAANVLGLGGGVGDKNTPQRVGAFADWTFVATGSSHALAIRDGKLYAWGSNSQGATGLGTSSGSTDQPTQVGTATNWQKVAAGSSFSLGIRGGELYSWGYNIEGQLGQGDTTQRTTPTRVGSSSTWQQVSANNSSWSSYAIDDGKLYAWGDNAYGQLGLGDKTDRNVPTQVGSSQDWKAIDAGVNHAVGIVQS